MSILNLGRYGGMVVRSTSDLGVVQRLGGADSMPITRKELRMFDRPLTRREALALTAGVFGAALGVPRVLSAAPPLAGWPEAVPRPLAQEVLPRTAALIDAAARRRAAGQIYVSRHGRVLVDRAWGTARNAAPMTAESIVSWASAVKPLTCTCLMKLVDAGEVGLDDPVTRFIPEFGVQGKGGVLVRHLLTHTAHLGGYTGPMQLAGGYDAVVRRIIESPRTGGARAQAPAPGTEPGYNPAGIWIVAEISRRLYDRPFDQVIRSEVFEPCGMTDSWCGMPVAKLREYVAAGRMASNYLADEATASIPQPAGGGLGPTRELARFYEMMLGGGSIAGRRILSAEAVEAMTTPKTGVGSSGVWGLGFNLPVPEGATLPTPGRALAGRLGQPGAGARAGALVGARGQAGAGDLAERLERRFGPHASARAFGHPGASGMIAFADPAHGLVIAVLGLAEATASVYEDLGLA